MFAVWMRVGRFHLTDAEFQRRVFNERKQFACYGQSREVQRQRNITLLSNPLITIGVGQEWDQL
jgi:hypothetical protein